MLVLSRKPGEEIVINDTIRVTVLAIRGKQVRLGLTAPHGVPIYREELCSVQRDVRPAPAGRRGPGRT
jgi:carbon storage regulator